MTHPTQYHKNHLGTAERPPLEAFWGSGDEAKALIRDCQQFLNSRAPSPPDPAAVPRKPRKPSIRKLVEQAEKAGKTVTSITTPDGTRLDFGEADRATNFNPWDRVLPNASKIPS
jgi:hypothetical protein